jgi:hypothetical protein
VCRGFIAPSVFVNSLFLSGLNIYEAHKSGTRYIFVLMCFFDGGHKTGRRK